MTEYSNHIRHEGMLEYGFGPEIMKSIKVCPSCKTITNATESICKECNAQLSDDNLFQIYKRRHRFCPKCDTIVADIVHFCPQCGERILHKSADENIYSNDSII